MACMYITWFSVECQSANRYQVQLYPLYGTIHVSAVISPLTTCYTASPHHVVALVTIVNHENLTSVTDALQVYFWAISSRLKYLKGELILTKEVRS